jgi:hypothetical protein
VLMELKRKTSFKLKVERIDRVDRVDKVEKD